MKIAALILGIIGGLGALSLGAYGYALGNLFVLVSGGHFGPSLLAVSVFLPVMAIVGAAIVLSYPVMAGGLLIGSSIGIGAVLGLNFLSATTVLLLGIAGALAFASVTLAVRPAGLAGR